MHSTPNKGCSYHARPRWISVDVKPCANLQAREDEDPLHATVCGYTLFVGGTHMWLEECYGAVPLSEQDNGDMSDRVYGSHYQLTKESLLNLLTIINILRRQDDACDDCGRCSVSSRTRTPHTGRPIFG